MMNRLFPHPVLSLNLTVVWMLLSNEFSAGSLIMGLLLGWLIPLFSFRFWPEPVVIRRPLTLLRFIATVLYDILLANFIVAALIVRGPRKLKPAFVRVPLELKSELAISLLSNTICLTPGTVSAELAADQRSLLVHSLSTDDPQALVDTIKQRYETPLKQVFES